MPPNTIKLMGTAMAATLLVSAVSVSAGARPAWFARQEGPWPVSPALSSEPTSPDDGPSSSSSPTATARGVDRAAPVASTTSVGLAASGPAQAATTTVDLAALWPAKPTATHPARVGCVPSSVCPRLMNACGQNYGGCYDKNFCDGNTTPYPIPTCTKTASLPMLF